MEKTRRSAQATVARALFPETSPRTPYSFMEHRPAQGNITPAKSAHSRHFLHHLLFHLQESPFGLWHHCAHFTDEENVVQKVAIKCSIPLAWKVAEQRTEPRSMWLRSLDVSLVKSPLSVSSFMCPGRTALPTMRPATTSREGATNERLEIGRGWDRREWQGQRAPRA